MATFIINGEFDAAEFESRCRENLGNIGFLAEAVKNAEGIPSQQVYLEAQGHDPHLVDNLVKELASERNVVLSH
ncbi:MAG: hypothetical protein COV36_00270 [Alphaproteobacteria bacterium CG11_big_fil_rev_8_21_14_0_20_44_7]|nr:MAG: hypothetical protein COV36_00270 [Alphaproteobacteria bacterium CG11_big_fil_rev_8_21_14_0_20_44_7]